MPASTYVEMNMVLMTLLCVTVTAGIKASKPRINEPTSRGVTNPSRQFLYRLRVFSSGLSSGFEEAVVSIRLPIFLLITDDWSYFDLGLLRTGHPGKFACGCSKDGLDIR